MDWTTAAGWTTTTGWTALLSGAAGLEVDAVGCVRAHGDEPALGAAELAGPGASLVTPAKPASDPVPGLGWPIAPLSELPVGASEPGSVDELSPVDGEADPVPVDDEPGPGLGLGLWIGGLDWEFDGEGETRGLTVLQVGDGAAPNELPNNGLWP